MSGKRVLKHRFKKAKDLYQDAAWDHRFTELKEFRRQNGHCQVPSCYKKHPSLGYWVYYQRVLYRSGRLKAVRKLRLEKIGFDWVSRGRSVEFRDSTYWNAKWERMLARLVRFHQRYGHCRVPTVWQGSKSLNTWVKRQRRLGQQDRLDQYRWRRLNALGLDWHLDGLDPRWERCFQKLRDFRRRFGHCHVPAEWAEDINLGRWVVKMRRLNRAGRLSSEKLSLLDEIGFVWDAKGKRAGEQEALWSKWLAKLEAYHQQHGHWRVPTDQPKFHKLRVWMDNQRIRYQRGRLPEERIRRLEKLRFPLLSDRRRSLT